MFFLSYRTGTKFAVKNTGRFAQHAGTQPVKTEAAEA
jgi:ketopantoate hydroxymethyltransferase